MAVFWFCCNIHFCQPISEKKSDWFQPLLIYLHWGVLFWKPIPDRVNYLKVVYLYILHIHHQILLWVCFGVRGIFVFEKKNIPTYHKNTTTSFGISRATPGGWNDGNGLRSRGQAGLYTVRREAASGVGEAVDGGGRLRLCRPWRTTGVRLPAPRVLSGGPCRAKEGVLHR